MTQANLSIYVNRDTDILRKRSGGGGQESYPIENIGIAGGGGGGEGEGEGGQSKWKE